MVPATPAMPTHITVNRREGGKRGEIGPHDQRRFRLADEDVGGRDSDSTRLMPVTQPMAPPTQRTIRCMMPR